MSAFEADMKKNQLNRVLGKWGLTSLGIGAIIGGGTVHVADTPPAQVKQYRQTKTTKPIRGRQMAMKIESSGLGVAWQLGAPRLDLRVDGRR